MAEGDRVQPKGKAGGGGPLGISIEPPSELNVINEEFNNDYHLIKTLLNQKCKSFPPSTLCSVVSTGLLRMPRGFAGRPGEIEELGLLSARLWHWLRRC